MRQIQNANCHCTTVPTVNPASQTNPENPANPENPESQANPDNPANPTKNRLKISKIVKIDSHHFDVSISQRFELHFQFMHLVIYHLNLFFFGMQFLVFF